MARGSRGPLGEKSWLRFVVHHHMLAPGESVRPHELRSYRWRTDVTPGRRKHFGFLSFSIEADSTHEHQRAHGVAVSHPLRTQKALGSNPSVPNFEQDLRGPFGDIGSPLDVP